MFRNATWHAIHSWNLAVVSHPLPGPMGRGRRAPRAHYFLTETHGGLDVGPPVPIDPASPPSFASIPDVAQPVAAFGIPNQGGGSHVAVKVAERDWLVFHRPVRGLDPPRKEWARVTIPRGEVVGFVPTSKAPAFVVVEGERLLDLRYVEEPHRRTRPRAFGQRIRRVVCATEAPIVAVALEDGTVQVVELELDRLLLVARGQVR